MDLHHLRHHSRILFECISGSRSYGLDLPQSDTDIKGVFLLSKKEYYGLEYVDQVSNDKNDIIFYELKRFFELLYKNNPNILELLGVQPQSIVYRHPLMEKVRPELFLSRQCRQTFANYAVAQVKKARGLNKKINKPVDRERKNILHFCFVTQASGSVPLHSWLKREGRTQEQCGLAAINHMRDLYALFTDPDGALGYRGIMAKEVSNEVTLSSIPKDETPAAYMYFNKDGYSTYCKEYKSYWEWTEKRNEERYQNTLQHGKNYDAKNMMHVFRLLGMAEEIARGQGVITKRPDRDFLLRIRAGEFAYDDLLLQAEEKIREIDYLYEISDLPELPDREKIDELLYALRAELYQS
ncbi:nucleotidyltransferase domain-containing protein [Paraflavisolibacter sp. H34]|uniref:DNA polymerase beta superfamily protein n=1 Tax=Huijunlia imazamoxiresistens TaxID=3127457 RepID=UPI0030179D99